MVTPTTRMFKDSKLTYSRINDSKSALEAIHSEQPVRAAAGQRRDQLADVLVLRRSPLPEQLPRQLYPLETFFVLVWILNDTQATIVKSCSKTNSRGKFGIKRSPKPSSINGLFNTEIFFQFHPVQTNKLFSYILV